MIYLTIVCISDWVVILIKCSKIGSEQYPTLEFRIFFSISTFLLTLIWTDFVTFNMNVLKDPKEM